jgi:DNA (cytosine-5)-methyltransferase 1
MTKPVPVVDLFAGTGGMGEGFVSFTAGDGRPIFRISLSIEKDPAAYETLLTRTFYRQFPRGKVPGLYYEYLRGNVDRDSLFREHKKEAARALREAWHVELSPESHEKVRHRIEQSLGDRSGKRAWVLVGGPPCQVYSTMGRARMSKVREAAPEEFERDERHYLYREYLRVIADHCPPVFVMENVKGLLTSTIRGEKIFGQILNDLQRPQQALSQYGTKSRNGKGGGVVYNIYSLSKGRSLHTGINPSDFLVEAERYGIPQTRHRIFLLGVRTDIGVKPSTLVPGPKAAVKSVLADLPPLRSGVSRNKDSDAAWLSILKSVRECGWFEDVRQKDRELADEILSAVERANIAELNPGAEFVPDISRGNELPLWLRDWFPDTNIGGVCNHSARSHMREDLYRYLFAASFASLKEVSPHLRDYPTQLLPDHSNVEAGVEENVFSDRFKVQVDSKPASTVTSHIHSDGHYYIHPDPAQCRSLTVREAARLQTFPDNYFFEGARTDQYRQVGNAVPPYLAKQIAEVVYEVLLRAGLVKIQAGF